MKDAIKTIIKTIKTNIYVGDRYKRNLQAISIEAALVFVIGLVMFFVCMASYDYNAVYTPVLFIIVSPICYWLIKFKKMRTLTIIITMTTILIVFSFAIFFVRNGFTYLWIMLIPLTVSLLFGIKEGILVTVYFEILFIVAFYTPVKEFLGDNYQTIITNRFPILYFFNGLSTIIVTYQYHKSAIFEIESEKRLQEEVKKQTSKAIERAMRLEKLSNDVVASLGRAIDAKDRYTNGHSSRVSFYAYKLGERIGLSDEELKSLERNALLHDIGKIGVPDNVLNKPTKLNPEELASIREHTVIGRKIVEGLENLKDCGDVAMYHHERYDGTGYPEGLVGENIPLYARIVAIADAYDAMNSERVYRSALSREKIRQEFIDGKGTQFDPNLAEIFIQLIDEKIV